MRHPTAFIIVSVLSVVFCNQAFPACSPGKIIRDDVLIVVNDNATESEQVGDYYCEQRGIDPANIVHVRVPATSDIQYDQFIFLRDQIIKFLLENTLTAGTQPVSCDQTLGFSRYYCPESMDQIRKFTRIRYLVLTKGIPGRFNYPNSTLAHTSVAVVDNYLRFWLLNYFDQDVRFTFNTRAIDFGDGRGMRTVEPTIDRELIVGRIDGIKVSSAMNLVDRAITAEKSGIFGKLYSSKYGRPAHLSGRNGAYWKQWLPNGATRIIYPSWEYLHGLFGYFQTPTKSAVRHNVNPECLTYDANGKIPQSCVTKLSSGATARETKNDPPPGFSKGRIPRADSALVYQGDRDGFSSTYSFSDLLNWRETDNCSTLCASNDASCRKASSDIFKEIDTRCVRVVDGFIGYNFQSYPVGMMAAWPTGWFQNLRNSGLFSSTGSQHYYMWPPEIRDDAGFDDNYSLWYRNTEQKNTAACYTNNDELQNIPSGACVQEKRININQLVRFPKHSVNLVNPQTITVRFKYRALDLNKALRLQVRFFVHETVYQDQSITLSDNNQIDYGQVTAAILTAPNTPADAVSWGDAVASFTLDPTLHKHPQYFYNGIKVRIESDKTFEGQLAIDTVSVEEDGIGFPLKNASFDGGHQQVSGGDSAATFLSRLNGTAFWANLSHHEGEGHSFDSHPYETLIYFLRGLPLGDAVWFAETHNSGILYGDPLYSPAAIYLHRMPSSVPGAPNDHFITTSSPLALRGDTLNGSSTNVTTVYNVDYCSGHDFLPCDQSNSWLPIANLQNKPGGSRNMPLGNWDISTIPEGDYTLRLAVTSTNSAKGLSQTFYDYYPLTLFSPASDEDADGLSYSEESSLGTDPWDDDTDTDKLPDGWEVNNNLDPLTQNASVDSDNDGFKDFIEYSWLSDPTDANSVPAVSTYRVDPVDGIDDGQSPFQTLGAAIDVSKAGDTIFLASGTHTDGLIVFTKPVDLEGPADHSAIIHPSVILNNSSFNVAIRNLTLQTSSLFIRGADLEFKGDIIRGDTIIGSGSSISFTNTLFSAAPVTAIDVQSGGSITLDNCTVTNNTTGIRAAAGSNILIKNTIIAGNADADLVGVTPASVSYSLIGDPGYAGSNGNIAGNPLFVDPVNSDYRLLPNSPAVDAGDPASDYSLEPALSPAGRVDMGVWGNTAEATAASDPITTSNSSNNTSIENSASSETTPASSGGGGGGCTINASARLDPVWLLLLVVCLRLYLVGAARHRSYSSS